MATQDQTIRVSNDGGRLRVDLPAATIEADDADTLVTQVYHHGQTVVEQVKQFLENLIEDAALRELEKRPPGLDVLERLAARHPAPQQWYDEPD